MQLSPEQINQFLAESVMKSQIGRVVEDGIKKVVGDLQKAHDNPIEKVIRQHVTTCIIETIKSPPYSDQIKAGIEACLPTLLTDAFVLSLATAFIDKCQRKY